MTANRWKGVGPYDLFLTLSEEEMRSLTARYGVDWSFFTAGPAKCFDGKYFCFVSLSGRKLALLPFLSLVFGGMYEELPLESETDPIPPDLAD